MRNPAAKLLPNQMTACHSTSTATAATGSTLLLGATSIVGYNMARLYPDALVAVCTSRSRKPAVADWPRLHLEKQDEIAAFLQKWQPGTIIYCDAVCDVEKCEMNPDWARHINVQNLQNLLTVLPETVRLVYVSSDHVFGGDGVYDETTTPCPITVYGRSRVEAEELAAARKGSLIIRPGLPIGPSIDGRTGHRDWIRYRTENHLPITIVEDEHRSAVHVADLAQRILALAGSPLCGIRHVAAEAAIDRPALARHLLEGMGLPEQFTVQGRHKQRTPHLGHVELSTVHRDVLAQPLASVVLVNAVA